MPDNRRHIRYQRGATMVEMAITLMVFFIILFGIIDFSLLLYQLGKGLEVTRHTARQMIVSTPLATNFSELDSCDEAADIGKTTGPVTCDGACDDYAENVLDRYVEGDITVTYSCALTGRPDRGFLSDELIIPQVTIETKVKYRFLFAGIILNNLEAGVFERTFKVTRTGEDLDDVL